MAGSQGAGMRGVSIIEAMVIDMNEAQVRTLEQASGGGRYAGIGVSAGRG